MTIERDGESTLRLEGLRITDGGPFVCQVNIILVINKIILFAIIDKIILFAIIDKIILLKIIDKIILLKIINKIILFKIINNIVIFNNITAKIESTPGGDGRRRSFGGGASSYCPGFHNSV